MYGSLNAAGDLFIYTDYNLYDEKGRRIKKPSRSERFHFERDRSERKAQKLRRTQREVQNACAHLANTTRPRFYTFTLPGYPESLTCSKSGLRLRRETVESVAAAALRKTLDNLRTNYGLGRYVWVKEYQNKGYKGGRPTYNPHYHMLAEIGKIHLPRISRYWSAHFGREANNSIDAVTVRGYYKTVTYLSKYLTKETAQQSQGRRRGFAVSSKLQAHRKPFQIREDQFPNFSRDKVRYINEYVSVYNGPEILQEFREKTQKLTVETTK